MKIGLLTGSVGWARANRSVNVGQVMENLFLGKLIDGELIDGEFMDVTHVRDSGVK